AAHPYFPMPTASGALLDKHPQIFDAVEYCHYYVKNINFNKWAVSRASDLGKPLIGCSDAHTTRQMGRTYSLVDAEKTPEAIIEAIKEGKVEVVTRPYKAVTLLSISSQISFRNLHGRVKCLIKNGRYGYRGESEG
ncbi:MAG: PHP-associated domain-containing protein, partial [Nitrospirota bacterium]